MNFLGGWGEARRWGELAVEEGGASVSKFKFF